MNTINTLIKPTRSCNLRCKYCFHEKYGYDNNLLDMNKLKKYIDLLSQTYNHINIIWHGGEPLVVPLTYYEEIYDYCKKKNALFTYSMQTNGTLLNQENIDFFKANKTNIGISFDGLGNENTRSHTKETLKGIALLQKNNYYPGAIIVINGDNVNNLIEEYEYFKSLNLSMKLNPMFNDGAAINNALYLNADDYINNFIKLFKYWYRDNNCNINVTTCEELISLIFNKHSYVCTHNSCLGKWLCLDSDGEIYPCDRLCTNEYSLGNIDNINSINEVFLNDNFLKLLKYSVARRNECIKNCKYYKNCYAGCNSNAILSQENNYNQSCYIQKAILQEILNYLNNLNNNISHINQNHQKSLIRKI